MAYDDIPPGDAALHSAMQKVRRLTGPRSGITAELLHDGTWVEITARRDGGRMVARSGWSLEDFSVERLKQFSEWLEREVARIERRHLKAL